MPVLVAVMMIVGIVEARPMSVMPAPVPAEAEPETVTVMMPGMIWVVAGTCIPWIIPEWIVVPPGIIVNTMNPPGTMIIHITIVWIEDNLDARYIFILLLVDIFLCISKIGYVIRTSQRVAEIGCLTVEV
jgi:hypothetical protein